MKWRLDNGQIEAVDDDLAEILRRKTPAERVAMIGACNRTMRLLLDGHFRRCHPEWDDRRIAAAVARRMCSGTD